jgi:hypothetical protein
VEGVVEDGEDVGYSSGGDEGRLVEGVEAPDVEVSGARDQVDPAHFLPLWCVSYC